MNYRSDRHEICLADERDDDALNAIFAGCGFPGGISVLFTRRPRPFRSLQNDGEKAVVCLLREKSSGQAIGMGACVIQKAYMGGEVKRAGYLTGLKLLPQYRGQVRCIPECYEFMHAQTRHEVDFYYTTILEGNSAAWKMLEKRRKIMPDYLPRGGYTVYALKTGGARRASGGAGRGLTRGFTEEIDDFYARRLPKLQFAPAGIDLPGLEKRDFFAWRRGGRVAAACALWDQRRYKQYVIASYSGAYRWLRGIPLRLLGYPPLPEAGASANYVSVALLCADDAAAARRLLRGVLRAAPEYDFALAGLHETSPLNGAFQGPGGLRHFQYRSRLYIVDFGGETVFPGGVAAGREYIHLEPGLL
jgi:hypothetical protein